MKETILILTTSLIFTITTLGQRVIEKKYYKKLNDNIEVTEKKGKIVELTIRNPDSTVQYELRQIKDNTLLRLKKYKNGKPYGKWVFNINEGNYYELLYTIDEYKDCLKYDVKEKVLEIDIEGEFIEPVFPEYGNNFLEYVNVNLKYPLLAIEKGLQGEVLTQFYINERGEIANLSILHSAGIELDREAVRVISQAPRWESAKFNNKPIKVHVVIPTNFILK